MCRSTGSSGKRFRPDTKCCSFFPYLPNYTVGGILCDTSSEAQIGRATVEARIDARIAVTPLGISPPPTYSLLYAHASAAFGVSRTLRCPHFVEEGGLCGIWRYRNSVCSTYFCQVVRGRVGRAFWQHLQALLGEIESTLKLWCVEQLDLGSAPLKRLLASADARQDGQLTAADIDNQSDPGLYRQTWGDRWFGRERELYTESWRLVSALSWSDVSTLAGPKLRSLARMSREAYADLVSEALPDRLRRGSFSVTATEREYVILQGTGSTDQLLVLPRVVDVLPLFDGQRSTAEVRTLVKHSGIRISDWVVRQLVDFEILVPAP
jgi:hypothetical protein